MKLTDPDIIKEGEKDLIDAIKDDLDLDSINEIIKEKLKIKNLESKGGRIIVHNNEVAFKIDFELSLNGSLMFDRNGNHIPDDDDKADIDDSDETKPDKADDTDKEKKEDSKEDDEIDLGGDVESIAQELIAEDDLTEGDLPDDSDSSASSELDLDVGSFEDSDEDEDEIDFSDDEDIDEILKESRDFWEKKKK